ncbi:MAG: type I restriction enzyme S subunit [Thalassolituus oleivorans]|jgi:type I restriction enzyme S subunit
MSAEWLEFQLGERCNVKSSKRIFAHEYVDFGIPFMRSKDVIEKALGTFIDYDLHISEERFFEIKKTHGSPKKSDLLISSVGNRSGQPYVIKDEGDFHFKDGNILWLSEFSDINSDYLAYWIKSDIGQESLASVMIGSAQKALTIDSLRKLWLKFPTIDNQNKIAEIFLSLDNKIQLNRQINQTLESMAQAIFQSWFVDFDPVKAKIAAREQWQILTDDERTEWLNGLLETQDYFKTCLSELTANGEQSASEILYLNIAAMTAISSRDETSLADMPGAEFVQLYKTASLFPERLLESELGEMPEGWSVGILGDLIEFNPRRTLKKGTVAPYLDMKNVPTSGHLADEVLDRELGSGTKFINGDTLLARITPCLENGKTAFVDFLEDNQVGWGSTEYIVMRPKANLPVSLGYFIARNEEFRQHAVQSMTGTSGRQRANAKTLEILDWLIYPIDLLLAFNELSERYLRIAKTNGGQSKVLGEIRDVLLPKLLSGELIKIEKSV